MFAAISTPSEGPADPPRVNHSPGAPPAPPHTFPSRRSSSQASLNFLAGFFGGAIHPCKAAKSTTATIAFSIVVLRVEVEGSDRPDLQVAVEHARHDEGHDHQGDSEG